MLPNPQTSENQQPSENGTSSPLEAVRRAFPLERWGEHPLVLGISGGPDSVALLRLLLEHRSQSDRCPPLILAHCNYGLRGEESEQDEQFVSDLARRFEVECRVWRAEKLEKPGGSGWEAYLRDIRYDFFKQVSRDFGARYLALAHSADDQAETVTMRLLRGSSLAGLRGIPSQRPLTKETTLIRPLLTLRRQMLREYLLRIDQPFRIDSSNESDQFLRNRIRNQLLPLLSSAYGTDFSERMLSLAEEAAEVEALLDEGSSRLLAHFDSHQPDCLRIATTPLAAHPPALVRHALVKAWRDRGWSERDLTSRHWHALAELLLRPVPETGSVNLPESRVARRTSDGTVLVR
ncbi:MAG: tRNA lysidine(34) synthetase TilS [Planctomycetota bacterium]